MSRVVDSTPPRRGSPSEVFSHDINQIHKEREKKQGCTRSVAILCAILAVVFCISTIVLAVVLAKQVSNNHKMKEEQAELQERIVPINRQPLTSADGAAGNSLIYDPSENNPQRDNAPMLSRDWPQPSGSLFAHYKKAAVASDHGLCSEIGRDVLIDGGNAVEAMIATLTCIGVVNPQSSGMGGGFLMTLFNSTTGRCQSINARETAPTGTFAEMFVNDSSQSVTGYRSIATPSELHGYWTVFKKFGSGKVSWSRLMDPAIHLCMDGFPVSSNLAMVLSDKENDILKEPTMKSIFVDPSTNRVYEEGDILKRKTLGFTLQLIANATDPVELFYRGGMAQTIAAEISDNGGYVDLNDLSSYETLIEENPVIGAMPGDLEMCGPPPPSSFVITQSIIAVMAEFYHGQEVDLDDPLIYHRLIEAEKFAYAQRTKLGDGAFVETSKELVANMTNNKYAKHIASLIKDTAQPQEYYMGDMTTQASMDLAEVPDHGTSHVTIIDTHGNAVASTSTINQIFGSMRASPTLGVLWNDQMDDFSSPGMTNAFGFAPSPSNFIAPGKHPMSSMSPTIIYNKDENKVVMVTGASGGSFIISATAQAVVRTLLFNQTVKEAVDAPRMHNQYLPHVTQFEQTVPKPQPFPHGQAHSPSAATIEHIIDALVNDHGQNMSAVTVQKSVVQALEVKHDGFIHGNSDFRRKTSTYPAGF